MDHIKAGGAFQGLPWDYGLVTQHTATSATITNKEAAVRTIFNSRRSMNDLQHHAEHASIMGKTQYMGHQYAAPMIMAQILLPQHPSDSHMNLAKHCSNLLWIVADA